LESGWKVGVDVLFDENSYDEMFAALKVAQVHLNDSNSPKALDKGVDGANHTNI
jgi:hypothetical protein